MQLKISWRAREKVTLWIAFWTIRSSSRLRVYYSGVEQYIFYYISNNLILSLNKIVFTFRIHIFALLVRNHHILQSQLSIPIVLEMLQWCYVTTATLCRLLLNLVFAAVRIVRVCLTNGLCIATACLKISIIFWQWVNFFA